MNETTNVCPRCGASFTCGDGTGLPVAVSDSKDGWTVGAGVATARVATRK